MITGDNSLDFLFYFISPTTVDVSDDFRVFAAVGSGNWEFTNGASGP